MEKIIRRKELAKLLGVSISTLDRWVRENSFPKPVKLGKRLSVWLVSDIEEFLKSKKLSS